MNKPMNATMPEVDKSLELIEREAAPWRRNLYGLLLAANAVVLAGVLSLWLTEPGPLPSRLHVAFGGLVAISAGWTILLVCILTRRQPNLGRDRIAVGAMALFASILFTAIGVGVAVTRGTWWHAASVAGAGLPLVLLATSLLVRARRRHRALLRRYAELQETA